MRKTLATWGGKRKFDYEGSVPTGTVIWYGKKPYRAEVTQDQYERLSKHFNGRTVLMGTSRIPPLDSVGAWLQAHVTRTAIASYVGAILVHEGPAERVPEESSEIRFK